VRVGVAVISSGGTGVSVGNRIGIGVGLICKAGAAATDDPNIRTAGIAKSAMPPRRQTAFAAWVLQIIGPSP